MVHGGFHRQAEATVVRYLPLPLRTPAARRVQPRLAGEAPFR